MLKQKYNIADMKFKKLRKNSSYKTKVTNNGNFVQWILNVLETVEATVPQGKRYNACSISMNSKGLEELSKYLDPMIWLNYSPTTDDSLLDGEIGIDKAKVLIGDLNENN